MKRVSNIISCVFVYFYIFSLINLWKNHAYKSWLRVNRKRGAPVEKRETSRRTASGELPPIGNDILNRSRISFPVITNGNHGKRVNQLIQRFVIINQRTVRPRNRTKFPSRLVVCFNGSLRDH